MQPAVAQAAKDELILALEPGWALLSDGDGSHHGGTIGGSAWLGLTDDFWLSLSGGGSQHLVAPDAKGTRYEALGGLALALDVFRAVPYAEASLGITMSPESIAPTVRLGLGADVLVSKSVSIGVVARYRPLPVEQGSALYSIALRLGWRIEIFW